jgi:hypothetical protein
MGRRRSWVIAVTIAGLGLTACEGDEAHLVETVARDEGGTDASVEASLEAEAISEVDAESTSDTDAADAIIAAREAGMADPAYVLAAQSPSCLECATFSCAMYLETCATVGGVAAAGPAQGAPKAELCVETLGCILSSGCASCADQPGGCLARAKYCYCNWDDPMVVRVPRYCDPSLPQYAGPCRTALERSLETTNPSTLLGNLADPGRAGGWAVLLLQCLSDNQCASCFSPPGGASDAAVDGAHD